LYKQTSTLINFYGLGPAKGNKAKLDRSCKRKQLRWETWLGIRCLFSAVTAHEKWARFTGNNDREIAHEASEVLTCFVLKQRIFEVSLL